VLRSARFHKRIFVMSEVSRKINATAITLVRGDITRQQVDAIVNAANSRLMGGGGVDGAIHRAGGPAILEECMQIKKLEGGCPPGNAVITGAGKLQAKYVIHTVGPIWRNGNTNEAETLANAYRNSLRLALNYEAKTVAFPSISTGAFGYPVDDAAKLALDTVRRFCQEQTGIDEIRFVLFDEFTLQAYSAALEQVVPARP
jgi:O-acetyl-ADP-ribose deacetylase (regulator of RNase III)